MSQVYSKASRVIVWLGLPAANSNAAFKVIAAGDTAFPNRNAGVRAYGNFLSLSTTNLNAFSSLCEREYWSRLWVVQEIVLAKELVVHCGFDVATWSSFSRALQVYQAYDRIKSSLPYLFESQRSDRYYECRFLNLLEAFQASKCTDPRDKVYGLLGLANDCGEEELVVDYSKTLYEVYRDVITFHSSRSRTQQSLLSPRSDLDVVRFSQMLQRSLQNVLGDGDISPDAEIARLKPTTHNYVQPQLVMVTGVYAGRIVETKQPLLFEPFADPLTSLPCDTSGASLPTVEMCVPDTYLKPDSSLHSGGNPVMHSVSNDLA
jgi:hypothetical protein